MKPSFLSTRFAATLALLSCLPAALCGADAKKQSGPPDYTWLNVDSDHSATKKITVTVGGGVAAPGKLHLLASDTAWKAIEVAGVKAAEKIRTVHLKRKAKDGTTHVNFLDWRRRSEEVVPPLLCDGDEINVIEQLPIKFTLPKGFGGPNHTASKGPAQVYAYSRASADPGAKATFQVLVIALPPEARNESLEKILAGIVSGSIARIPGIKQSATAKTKLGPLDALSLDWEGVNGGNKMKGRMICALLGRQILSVQYGDSAAAWEQTHAELSQAIEAAELVK